MKRKLLALILAGSLTAMTAAQSAHSTPYVISIAGSIFDVGYDIEGLQPTVINGKLVSTKGCVKATASQNTQSLRTMCDSINGVEVPKVKWSLHRAEHNAGGLPMAQVSLTYGGVIGVHMPALDLAATQADFFELDFAATDVAFDGFTAFSAEEKAAVKAQKMWLPSNFRTSLGDLPTGRVSKVDAFTIKQGIADLDDNGRADFTVPEAITLTIPVDDASPYQDWFRAAASGQEIIKTLVIEYQDNDGVPVLTFSVPVIIESIGYSDLFLGTSATSGREVEVGCRAKGIVICKPGSVH